MIKSKFGVVAYDSERKSSKIYLDAFNRQFQQENFEFINAWDSVDSLINLVNDNGVPVINDLNKILILDSGFKNPLSATDVVEDLTSLQEVFTNRGVTRPFLLFATTNNRVYDIYKTGSSPNGHDLFVYLKTRIFHLTRDSNGSINVAQIANIITGRSDDTALSIRKDYQSRGDLVQDKFEQIKQEATNKNINTLNEIRQQLKSEAQKDGNQLVKSKDEMVQEQKDKLFDSHERKVNNIFDNLKDEIINNQQNQPQTNQQQNQKKVNNIFAHISDEIGQEKTDIDLVKYFKNKKLLIQDCWQKLLIEKNVICFAGKTGSGTTSLIANFAKIYSMFNRKVLLINFAENDDITSYFSSFADYYQEKRLNNIFEQPFLNLDEILIQVNQNISIISDLGSNQRSQNILVKTRSAKRIIEIAKREYDLILIDCGQNFNEVYANVNSFVDNLIFVSKFDELTKLDDLTNDKILFEQNILNFAEKTSKRPGIVVQQILFPTTYHQIKNEIHKLKILDRSRLIGEVAFDKYWQLQKQSQIMFCNQNSINYRQIIMLTENLVV